MKNLLKFKRVRFRISRWWFLIVILLVTICFVFGSNHFFYLSHQRFPRLSRVQWSHASASVESRPIIVGHRGSGLPGLANHQGLIGNTKRSIQGGIDAGADWIEIDIRSSRDGHLIVFHDEILDDKTNQTGMVEDFDLADLKSIEVLVDPVERILTLQEVFNDFRLPGQHWILDIKQRGLSEQVVEVLKNSKIPRDQIIIFGSHEILDEYQGMGFRLGYTALFQEHRTMLLFPQPVLSRCLQKDCRLLVVPVIFVTPKLIACANANQIEVWSYDSNDPRDLEYCVQCGVNGLIVDMPGAAIAQFGQRSVRN